MSISTTSSVVEYTCDGVLATFSVPFKFLDRTHLRVSRVLLAAPNTETVLVIDSDYSVGGAGAPTGGSVTLVDPATDAPTGYKLRIRRLTPRTQGTRFSTQGAFSPRAHEEAFDRLTMINQELNDAAVIATAFDFTLTSPPEAVSVLAAGSVTPRPLADHFADVVNVKNFGAVGDGVANDTAAVQAAINAAQSSGAALHIPAGTYRITSSLAISEKIKLYGDGNQRTILSLATGSSATYAIVVSVPDNASIIGLDIGHFGITANAGAAAGGGVKLTTTATNSAISQSRVHDLYIRNVSTGVDMDGVIYMSTFHNITVTGGVASYGWHALSSINQIIYNSFTDLEVTNVGAAAYAYHITAYGSQLRNLTADGVSYFSGPYSHIQGIAIEGIFAASTASSYAIQANQIQSIQDVSIQNVPNSKCTYGLDVIGTSISVTNVRFPDTGAGNQPDHPINLHVNNSGTLTNVVMDRTPVLQLEDYLSDAILAGWVITGSSGVSSHDLTYAHGTWTPTFPSGWTTAPTVISAQYTKIGRQVTVALYAHEGVATAGAQVGGLPYAANGTQGAALAGSASDPSIRLAASIIPSASVMNNIPAATLTGVYWQLSGTYFAP